MIKGFSKTILTDGTRVISEYIPSVRSVSIGVWINVGSRDEMLDVSGVSHFIEHMHFKRTRKRTSFEIAQALEALGGSINAFTSRENTCYYARILNRHLPLAMDVLSDILNNSTFTPGDIKKEKQVILEEIKDVADTPAEFIHDLFSEQMWRGHSLGQPILGGPEIIAGLKRAKVLKYIRDHYQGANIVVAAAGDVNHRELVKMVKKSFKWPSNGYVRSDDLPTPNGFTVRAYPNQTNQTQVCLGFPSISFPDLDRYPLLAANTLLSGGMSSRLFQSVREKAGYCYNISSFQEFFRDIGMYCVYFGSDKKYVVKATDLVLTELRRLKDKLLTKTELSQIKEQLKGSLVLAQESTYNRMNRIARQELMLDEYLDLDETIRNIDRITTRQVRNVANRVFDTTHLTFTSLGPTRKKELEDINWSIL
ncbi:MAG: insulinase family protein [FCB group bacterium]|nr:insulinase family protein [FCB group bacterium]